MTPERIVARGPVAMTLVGCGSGSQDGCALDARLIALIEANPRYRLHDGWLELDDGRTRLAFVPVDHWPAPSAEVVAGRLAGRWTLSRDVGGIPGVDTGDGSAPSFVVDPRPPGRITVSSGCNAATYLLRVDGSRLRLTGDGWSRTEILCPGETAAAPSLWAFFESGPFVQVHDGWLELSGPDERQAWLAAPTS